MNRLLAIAGLLFLVLSIFLFASGCRGEHSIFSADLTPTTQAELEQRAAEIANNAETGNYGAAGSGLLGLLLLWASSKYRRKSEANDIDTVRRVERGKAAMAKMTNGDAAKPNAG